MNAFTIIPPHDFDRYGRLPKLAKEKYGQLADAVLEISALSRGIMQAVREKAAKLRCSTGHLRRKLDEWKETNGDWTVFVNKSLAGRDWWDTNAEALPADFLEFWWGLCGRNQRGKCLTQHRDLLRRLHAWRRGDLSKKIPGYDVPPQDNPSSNPPCPAGWSYRNLMRQKAPAQRKLELALTCQGVTAALKLLPPIPGSRVGVRFLEFVSIDDVWQDRKAHVPGYGIQRLLQMGAMDYASGVYLKFGLRPEIPTDDGTRERLKERDAKQLIAMLLEEFGYPADYVMHIICERGTATIREADARALFDLSGGRIKVCYTSMEGGLVLVWQESSTGNSRGKAWHESWHNLFHNEMATLPGQVGKDNEHQPRALMAMEKEAGSLITASHFLTTEQRVRLKLPFSSLEEAHFETLEVVRRINNRRGHDCEGFDTLLEWRLPGFDMPTQPESALVKLDPAMLERVEYSPRLETPWERMQKLRAGVAFNKIPAWVLPRFYEDSHALRPIKGHRFTAVKDGRNYVFKPARPEDELPEDGREYLGYFRPIDPDCVHLVDEAGSFVATWARERGIMRGDQRAVAEAIREKTSLLNRTMDVVRRQNRSFIADEEKRIRANAAVLEEAGLLGSGAPSVATGKEVLTPGAAALAMAVKIQAKAAQETPPVKVDDCTEELLAAAEK